MLLLHHNSCNRNCAAHKDKIFIFKVTEKENISISYHPQITQYSFQKNEFVPIAGNWNPLVAF